MTQQTMSTEQALGYPGELLAVWDLSAKEEHLIVYAVNGTRLERLSLEPMSAARRAELSAELGARGVRQAASDMPGPFVWSTDGGFTVWALTGVVVGVIAEGQDGNITTHAGARIRRADVERVVSFFDEDSPGHRGVNVVTRGDAAIAIAEEDSAAAKLDPTYGIDHVMIEGAWATFLGRDLAAWLGVPHTDELP